MATARCFITTLSQEIALIEIASTYAWAFSWISGVEIRSANYGDKIFDEWSEFHHSPTPWSVLRQTGTPSHTSHPWFVSWQTTSSKTACNVKLLQPLESGTVSDALSGNSSEGGMKIKLLTLQGRTPDGNIWPTLLNGVSTRVLTVPSSQGGGRGGSEFPRFSTNFPHGISMA